MVSFSYLNIFIVVYIKYFVTKSKIDGPSDTFYSWMLIVSCAGITVVLQDLYFSVAVVKIEHFKQCIIFYLSTPYSKFSCCCYLSVIVCVLHVFICTVRCFAFSWNNSVNCVSCSIIIELFVTPIYPPPRSFFIFVSSEGAQLRQYNLIMSRCSFRLPQMTSVHVFH